MANIDYAGLFSNGQDKQASPFTSPSRDQQLLGFAAKQNEALTGRLGGMFGLQQQDPVELAKTQLVGLDPTKAADQEQFIKLLNIIDPGKAAQFKQQLDAKKAKSVAAEAAAKLEQSRYDIQRGDVADQLRLGNKKLDIDEEKIKSKALETTQVKRFDKERGENVIDHVLKSDPNVVVKTVLAPQNAMEEYASIQKVINEAGNLSNAANIKERAALNVANMLEKYKPAAGFTGTLVEWVKAAGGSQDEASATRTAAMALVTGEAIASLPQGPATDKDIELARKGTPPANADAAYLASYARGVAKLARRESRYYMDKSSWFSLHNTPKGFLSSQTIKRVEETLEGMTSPTQLEMMKKVRASYGEANEQDNRIVFENTFGFDLKNLDQDYELAKQVVEKVTGGN